MLRADTLRDVLAEARACLARAGVASPRFDAERLAAHAFGVAWGDLWSRMGSGLDSSAAARFDALIQRRASGEPLAYIEGRAVFYGLELSCGPGVLVPRPETETLVEVALELAGDRPTVVDLGTGTGAVAIAIALARPGAEVWATDRSPTALRYARDNAARLAPDVRCVEGDLFAALPDRLRGRVDLVVSNPPYIPDGTAVPADVGAEPPDALFAGPRGDETLERIVAKADGWLRSGGALALEIGDPSQTGVVDGGHVRSDLTGRPRVVWTTR